MATVNLEFATAQGVPVVVEVEDKRGGPQRVARDGVILQAGRRLEDALEAARPTVEAVIKALDGVPADEREVEFGLKLTTEAGAVVAKTAVEGHFVLRLTWRRDSSTAG
jgi:hypothetical protein